MYTTNPLQINVLEYRLADSERNYPSIYHVSDIDSMEIFCRRNCEYFTLNGKVYENVGSAMEPTKYVIYLQEVSNEKPNPKAPILRKLGVEVRLFSEDGVYRELDFLDCYTHQMVLGYLDNTYIYLGKTEYERTSAELDQDRRTFVMYVKPTGMELS